MRKDWFNSVSVVITVDRLFPVCHGQVHVHSNVFSFLLLPFTTSVTTSRCISVSFSQSHEEDEKAVAEPTGCISLGNKQME